MLSWSQEDLAARSGLGVATIKRLEPGDGRLPVRLATAYKLQAAFEAAGLEFIDENGGGPGVRFKHRAD